MKIKHRIAQNGDDPFWKEIDRLGIDYDRAAPDKVRSGGISVLNVTEDLDEWPQIERLLVTHQVATHSVSNIYTKSELDCAPWLVMSASGHHGYPQPEDDYHVATYDLTEFCPTCGIGPVQERPFRLRADPGSKRSHFVQLNWVFDEFFLSEETREGLQSSGIQGIEFLAPLLGRKERPSERLSQMVVKTTLPSAIDRTGLQPVTCQIQNEEFRPDSPSSNQEGPFCGRLKFHRTRRGPHRISGSAFEGAPSVVKSNEWFGSGRSANQLVIVSQEFRQVVTSAKWRGVSFEPVELVE